MVQAREKHTGIVLYSALEMAGEMQDQAKDWVSDFVAAQHLQWMLHVYRLGVMAEV